MPRTSAAEWGVAVRLVYAKALPAEFERRMARQLPAFEPLRLRLTKEQRRTANVSPGELIFRWRATEQLHCFICILPDTRDDQFMMEAGWSTHGCQGGAESDPGRRRVFLAIPLVVGGARVAVGDPRRQVDRPDARRRARVALPGDLQAHDRGTRAEPLVPCD